MERRNFLKLIVGGVAAGAAVRTWPFRVFSFPTEPKLIIPTYGADGGLPISLNRMDYLVMEEWRRANIPAMFELDDLFLRHIQKGKDEVSSRIMRVPINDNSFPG